MPSALLGPKQPWPKHCAGCRKFLMQLSSTVILRWLEDGNGQVLWYLYLCEACYWKLDPHVQRRAIEPPPPSRRTTERQWMGSLPFSPPPRTRSG